MDPNVQKVSTKGTAGTLAGAALGGILTGGVGAIVGSMAHGNKIETFSSTEMAFEFNDGNWIVVKFANTNDEDIIGSLNNVIINILKKRFSQTIASPFA
jgi:outer membrane lipoprotein SlyB